MKRKWQMVFLTFLIVATVIIIVQQRNMPYQHHSGMIFGTVYNVTYQSNDNLKEEIERELMKVDNALSMFNDSSVISTVNRGEKTISIDDNEQGRMFIEVCQLAQDIAVETDGAFDITVAPLVNLWGFGFKNNEQPTGAAVDSILQFIGYKGISLDATNATLTKNDPRIMLDCSAIAKGYGSDVVARLLKSHDIQNFMVEIGGEIVTQGVNAQRIPWRIGVTKPSDDSLNTGQEMQTVLNVTDKAMATSGNYRNFYYKDGKKYAHTINPKTGRPVQHSILSATVLAQDCATADAYATSFMVMGMEGAKEILEKHPDLMAYLIYSDSKGELATWSSPSMSKKILNQ